MISTQQLSDAVHEAVPRAIALRRKLHGIPELSFAEHATAAAIRGALAELGIAYTTGPAAGENVAPTATFAVIGDRNRPCVALRADIDALPITEATGVPYASTHPGRMHACGHDGHAAGLVGAAAVLKQFEAELPVCVLCIWQPAEEAGGGGGRLVRAGVLDGALPGLEGVKPQSIFALHGWGTMPVGTISTRPGPMMASTSVFRATFQGRGSHAAYPHLSRDPIVAAAEAVLCLQAIVSREVDPVDSAVVTVGVISGGTATNVIPETARIEATVRTLRNATREQLQAAIRRRLAGIAAAHDVGLDFTWQEGYPATLNDPAMADYVRDVARETLGPAAYAPAEVPVMGGEDFAYYLEKIPGCFVRLGLRPAGETSYPNAHTPAFNFNDDALLNAIHLLCALAIGRGQKR